MSRREPTVALRHMLDYARETIDLTSGKTRRDFEADRLLQLALTRLLEIIGEAANRVPKEEQAIYPEIPWSQIVSLRNRLIHGYDLVDLEILWHIISDEIPLLARQLEHILSDRH